ncbi:sulfatase-like hydrolase/transferase [Rubritalea spongiae]|uniref:Sulfatase-like hydrolase/transferase n=1 Tax=Rubritalea spongiae TaxID=430797 RepID=A0ABW5E0B9_9BACT
MRHFLLLSILCIQQALAKQQPNIILLLSDDQHWDATSVPMHPDFPSSSKKHQTPNLEKLALQGMRFSAAYSPAPVCAPTRVSILTGKSPAALHWCKASPVVKSSENTKYLASPSAKNIKDPTFASQLQKAGYKTAHFGKWHIGGGGPEAHGFDVSDGDIGNEQSSKFKDPNPVDIVGMTNRAKSFINSTVESPFYLQMSYLALHSPENASQKNKDKFAKLLPNDKERSVQRIALTADLDSGVGTLIDFLKEKQLLENTYIIYMADNGANSRTSNLRGGKGSLYEGGIRIPFIIVGPNIPANSWSHTPISGIDFFPTFCKLAGAGSLPDKLEGSDITPLFNKQLIKRSAPLLFHFPHYQKSPPQSALIAGNYKILYDYESQHTSLYNIHLDPAESNDLSTKNPEFAHQLKQQLFSQLTNINAAIPQPNPNFDPSKPTPNFDPRKPRHSK